MLLFGMVLRSFVLWVIFVSQTGCAVGPKKGALRSVTDMHVHVLFDVAAAQSMSKTRPPTPANVLALLADPRLAHLGAIVIAPEGIAATRLQNDALLAFVATDQRLFAIASVHPADGAAALAEMDRIKLLGAKALKLHQNTQHFDLLSAGVDAVVQHAGELGLPVLFEGTAVLDPSTFGKFAQVAAKHPKAKLILAHLGFADFRQLVMFAQLRSYPWWPNNVYFDVSAILPFYVDSPVQPELMWTIRTLGVDHVMFGSDFPVGTPTDAIDAISRFGFTDIELSAIARETAAKIFQLGL
jgi:uncharacterized protein